MATDELSAFRKIDGGAIHYAKPDVPWSAVRRTTFCTGRSISDGVTVNAAATCWSCRRKASREGMVSGATGAVVDASL